MSLIRIIYRIMGEELIHRSVVNLPVAMLVKKMFTNYH